MPLSWARLFQSPAQPMSCRYVHFSLLMSLEGSLQVPGCLFRYLLLSYVREFPAPRPTPMLEDHFSSAVATTNSVHLQLPSTSATLGCPIHSCEVSLFTDFKILESCISVHGWISECQDVKTVVQTCLTIIKLEFIKSLIVTTCLVIRGRRERRFLLLDIVCWELMCVFRVHEY
jgi:hypothetical protein